jgi:hypothetical protein
MSANLPLEPRIAQRSLPTLPQLHFHAQCARSRQARSFHPRPSQGFLSPHDLASSELARRRAQARQPPRFTTHFDNVYPRREEGKLLRFTSPYDYVDPQRWTFRLELHDEYWRGKEAGDKLLKTFSRTMNDYYVVGSDQPEFFAARVTRAVYRGPESEQRIWDPSHSLRRSGRRR